MFPIFIIVIPFFFISFLTFLYRKLFVTPYDVADKIVLITGASSGLGEACAKRFALSGAKVILCARNVTELNRVKEEIKTTKATHEALVYFMDVTKADDVELCVKGIEEKHGAVDVLISNAGVSQRGTVIDSGIGVHQSLMNINYFGQVNVVKAVLPSMIKKNEGFIISIGTVQGKIAIPFRSAYSASKHASQAFFDSLRAEVARDNINVTVVNPGYVRTNLSRNAVTSDGSKHGVLDKTTASGMSPSFVASCIFDTTLSRQSELSLADTKSSIAMYIRVIFPPLYFKIMEWKASSDRKTMRKDS